MPRILSALSLFLATLFAAGACQHAPARAISAAPQGAPLLRELSGDSIVFEADGSARSGASPYAFEPVQNGNPAKPRLSERPGTISRRAIEIQVPTDKSGHKERFEYKIARAADADGLHFDNARASRFSFQLAPPAAPFLGSAILFQGWQGYPFGPPVSLKIVAGSKPPYRLKLAVRNGQTGPDSATPDLEVWSRAMIQPGVWYDVIVFLEPRYGGTGGRLRLWIDGHPCADWRGQIGYDPSQVSGAYNGLDLKNGIYQPGVNNGHTFLYDHILLGTDFLSVSR